MSVAEIEMMKGFLEARIEEMTDKDLRDILDSSKSVSMQSFWRHALKYAPALLGLFG